MFTFTSFLHLKFTVFNTSVILKQMIQVSFREQQTKCSSRLLDKIPSWVLNFPTTFKCKIQL